MENKFVTRRKIKHTDNHYDIEELRTDSDGNEVWAVIFCSEDEMTPQRPIELVNASKACAEAWLKRDAMIDANDKEGVKAMDLTCDLLQERYNSIYRQWQELGGTSNIDSIAFPPQFTDGFADERLDWDVTPKQNMPEINMNDIPEIPF